MATIRKREWTTPKGELKTAWLVDYRDGTGKRRAKQFDRKKDAEAWSTKALYDVTQGVHTPDSQSITVAKAGELWIERGRLEELERSTIDGYESVLRLHIVPLIGSKKLNQITKPAAEEYRDTLLKTRTRAGAQRALRFTTMLVGDAQRRGLVAQNVFLGVKLGRKKREKPKPIIPTKAEVRLVLDAAGRTKRAMDKALCFLMVFTGMRVSELRGLPWSGVDLKAATVEIVQRADKYNEIGPPKSDAGRRTIPLPPMVVSVLRQWKLRCPKNDLDLVFPSEVGTPIFYPNIILGFLEPVLRLAGLQRPKVYMKGPRKGQPVLDKTGVQILEGRYGMHDFRHCAASMWIEHRVDAKRVQTWMGHSSIQVTFDTYGHLFKEAEADAAIAQAIQDAVFAEADATPMQHGG